MFEILKSFFSPGKSELQRKAEAMLTRENFEYMFRQGESSTGVYVTEKATLGQSTAFACIRILSDSLAIMPLNLMKKQAGKTVSMSDHPIQKLLDAPNPTQTTLDFKKFMMFCLVTNGNFYYLKVKSRGKIVELIPLPTDLVQVKQEDLITLSYKVYKDNGFEDVDPSEIGHIRALSNNGLIGYSVLTAAREALGMSISAERYGGGLFRNSARPSGALEMPGALSSDAIKRLKEELEKNFVGSMNAGRPMVLENGMKWSTFSMTNTDAEFLASRQFQVEEICRFYGVPPFMVGHVTKTSSWGAGIEQQLIGFLTFSLMPWMVNIEKALARDLLGDNPEKMYFKLNEKILLRVDTKTQSESYEKNIQNGIMTPNEVRAKEDMNPRTDIGGDSYWMPLNFQRTDVPPPEPAPAPEPAPTPPAP